MPESLKKLVEYIAYLPGIGEKTATKLAFFLLKSQNSYVDELSRTLHRVKKEVGECPICFSLMDSDKECCNFCADPHRDNHTICVIEDALDLLSIERIGIFKGRYHVLGGSISPLSGRLPSDLHFKELFSRIKETSGLEEIIVATNPNIEGEATYLYIKENIGSSSIKLSRLSRGLPNAGYIEYADDITLINAFKGRG